MNPNYPESDIQFLARMLLRVQAQDQIATKDQNRMEEIARVGHSSQPASDISGMSTSDIEAVQGGATRVGP